MRIIGIFLLLFYITYDGTRIVLKKAFLFLKQVRISFFFSLRYFLKKQVGIVSRTMKKLWLRLKRIRKKQKNYFAPKRLSLFGKMQYFIMGSIFSFLFFFIPLLCVIFLQDLPNPSQLSIQQVAQTTKIFDRNHILLYEIYANQNRTVVSLSDIPKNLQHATIAIEDKNFYINPGFDISAMIRALVSNVTGGSFQGGSTITQQLIKSTLLSSERSFTRKIKEVILAFWAEKLYTKDQILQMYFNQVPYGGTAWGAQAAAEVYFGKNVKDLDLAQTAFLAGMPQAPTTYSPFGNNPTAWKKRQKDVLTRMTQLGYVTKQQAIEAVNEQLIFQPVQTPLHAPHFSMYIKELLIKKYGLEAVEKGGLQVLTSLDLSIQDKTQQIVFDEVAHDAYLRLTNGAALVTNPATGDILAMIGSHNYDDPQDGNVNVTTAFRQPGSSIKIVTYAGALSHGFTAATILDDSPITFTSSDGGPSYSPVNYDGKFHGKIPLRTAFANSFNIPAVKTLNTIGVSTFITLAKAMGASHLQNSPDYGLSITLGGAEVPMIDMATIYGTVANQGNRVDLNPILQITDAKGNILEQKTEITKTKVLDPGVTFIISDILADNTARTLEFGPNSPLLIPNHYVSVKTGTTDNKRDNWTIGFTSDYVVTVWVGNNDNSPMSPNLASGITGAAPIWHEVMSFLLDKHAETRPQQPSDVVVKPCFGKAEYFLQGTEDKVNCNPWPTTILSLTPAPTLLAPTPLITQQTQAPVAVNWKKRKR